MQLERHEIERKDFNAARRGYDPDEVADHLADIADAVSALKRERSAKGAGTVAGAAADQVRAIVEAAERSAAEIEERADEEAERITTEASTAARETRQRADADAAARIRQVEEAARGMQERAQSVESHVQDLLAKLDETTNALMEKLRASAEALQTDVRASGDALSKELKDSASSIERELASIRGGLGDLPQSGPLPSTPPAEEERAPLSVVPATPQPEPEQAREPEPEPEPEPPVEQRAEEPAAAVSSGEGARLVALNMALNGTPREETARYLAENFDVEDSDSILDEVYSRVGGG